MSDVRYRDIQLSQATIRYRETGSGPPIVFAHGLLVNGTLWDNVVARLSSDFRCILPDLPLGAHRIALPANADLTPPAIAKLVADFIAALDLHDVTLVGNDTGGAICQLVITEHPDRIERLVLTNCDAFEQFLPTIIRPFQWLGYMPALLDVYSKLFRVRAWQRIVSGLFLVTKYPVDAAVMDNWFAPIQSDPAIRRDLGKVLRGISGRYTVAAAKRFGSFDRPVLLAWAPDDRVFKIAFAKRLQAAFANATLQQIADSYTFSALDQPQQVADLIRSFVQHDTQAEAQFQAVGSSTN